MSYFLGRDVAVAMTTEHKNFGIAMNSNALDITGTDAGVTATYQAIPPRTHPLNKEESTEITFVQDDETTYESTSSGSNKYLLFYAADGTSYGVDFDCAGGSSYVSASQVAAADDQLKVGVSTSTGAAADIAATFVSNWQADAGFNAAFDVSRNGAVVTVTNKIDGDATNTVRGSGFADSIITVDTRGPNNISDITGVDVTYGTVDEDIAYLGQRTALKAEIKKETTVVITRKKGHSNSSAQTHELFSRLFNEARCGLRHTAGTIDADASIADALVVFDNSLNMPEATASGSNYGFRLHLQLSESNEVMSLKGCCITEYGTTLNADGVTEESITLYSHVAPVIASASNTTLLTRADF